MAPCGKLYRPGATTDWADGMPSGPTPYQVTFISAGPTNLTELRALTGAAGMPPVMAPTAATAPHGPIGGTGPMLPGPYGGRPGPPPPKPLSFFLPKKEP